MMMERDDDFDQDVEVVLLSGHVVQSPYNPPYSDREVQIVDKCQEIADMLVAKNRAYGDSALNPVRVFSRADVVEQLKVRIDDKLSRISRGSVDFESEDTVLDLAGYLVLLLIAGASDGE